MDEDELVARALEAPVELLPFLPELLADLDELGSDADQLTRTVESLALPPNARVIDLGCGKGATAIRVASRLGLRVLGLELFAPFVPHATAAAHAARVGHLCSFRHGDVRTMAALLEPADVAVFAALGDVLGDPATTMRIVRRYVRPGGYVVVSDVCLREGGSRAFDGFEGYRSRDETVQGLTAYGDRLVSEAIEREPAAEDTGDDDVTAIRRRAEDVALRHPEHREQLLAFAEYQARAHAHIAEHLVDAVWVLQREVGPRHTQAMG